MNRSSYFIRRLLLMIPTFIGITIICFTLTRFLPGGPVEQMLAQARGEQSEGGSSGEISEVDEEYKKHLIKHFGLDKSIPEAYINWLIVDMIGLRAKSFTYPNKTSWEVILERMPVSIIFGIVGFVLSYIICIPLGVAKALRDGGLFDLTSTLMIFVGYSLPVIAFGLILKLGFCGSSDTFFDIFPATGFEADNYATLSPWEKFVDRFNHMALPVLCYVIGNFAVLTSLMKNSLMEQISQDYIRTVIARGSGFNLAIWGHALRNALLPIATGFGGILTVMFAGSVIIERLFEIPGMGRLSLDAIIGRDYSIFMGILAITSIIGLIGNLLSDFCYMLIDPRINFDK